MKAETVTVEIKADTRQFDRQMRRVQWSLWWYRFGPWVTLAVMFLLGFVVGLLTLIAWHP